MVDREHATPDQASTEVATDEEYTAGSDDLDTWEVEDVPAYRNTDNGKEYLVAWKNTREPNSMGEMVPTEI